MFEKYSFHDEFHLPYVGGVFFVVYNKKTLKDKHNQIVLIIKEKR